MTTKAILQNYDDMILRASRPRYSAKSQNPATKMELMDSFEILFSEIKIITLIAPFRRGGWERGAEWRELYFKATTF